MSQRFAQPPALAPPPPTHVPPPTRKDPLLGTTLGERFRLDDLKGRGDWGVLYQALDLRRSQPVAIKVMHRDLPKALVVGRMKAARAYTGVKHERLGRIRAARFQEHAWIATEWMGGVSLRRMLRRHGHLVPRRTVELLMHLCRAVRPLHSAGLCHGNLKPNNVFLVPTERGDFLRLVDPGAVTDLVVPGALMSAKWSSPEQLEGELTAASDVFAIGMIAYRMLSGRAPFFGATPNLTRAALEACEPAGLKALVPNAPWQLIKVIERCLSKDPERRFPGVDSLLANLSECLPETDPVPEASSVSSERAVMVVRSTVIGEHETPAVPGPSAALLRAAAPAGRGGICSEASLAEIEDAIANVMSLHDEPSTDGMHADSDPGQFGELAESLPPLPVDDDPPDLFDSVEVPMIDDADLDRFDGDGSSWRQTLGKAMRRFSRRVDGE